jgi:glutamate N-acetyltransferase/amino-acid N-acetyltransferase
MIHPDMATMLSFVMTDAAADSAILDRILKNAVDSTFNCVSVDGDTSTNDVVVLMANGRAGNKLITEWGAEAEKLAEIIETVCRELAIQIVRDGEGVTKFVEINVCGAPSDKDAKKVGATISTSMLVKTAMFGNDANWGRILAAAGRSGVKFDPNLVDISIGGLELMKAGTPLGFSEEKALEILKKTDIKIDVNLHAGSGKAIYYTTDLSYDYIKINADYRT